MSAPATSRIPWRELFALIALAAAVRLALFFARGDYLGHDESYYLLLGRNWWAGQGYTLTDGPHVALSPLYAVLAGGVHALLGISLAWAGRAVTVCASALLVWPVWVITARFWGASVARLAALLLIAAPALVAFVPFWSGRELYAGGSEALFHLALFSATALLRPTIGRAAIAGALLGLATLARPEALVAATCLGAWALLPRDRRVLPALGRVVAYAAAFVLCIAPWVSYVHAHTGAWQISGRGGPRLAPAVTAAVTGARRSPAVASTDTIDVAKDLLWGGSEWGYIRDNYTLDANARRFRSNYWSVSPVPRSSELPTWTPLPPPPAKPAGARAALSDASRLELYARTVGELVPVVWWPFLVLGLLASGAAWRRAPGSRRLTEGVLVASVVGTSVAVAALVYVDPRNHLVLLPLLAMYTAVGVQALAVRLAVRQPVAGILLAPRYAAIATAGILLVTGGTLAQQVVMALRMGSPQHATATAMRVASSELAAALSEDAPIMSWHPAFAVYASRPWRVLPYEPLPVVARYARSEGVSAVVVTTFHHAPVSVRGIAPVVAFRLDSALTDADSAVTARIGAEGDPLRWGVVMPSGGDAATPRSD